MRTRVNIFLAGLLLTLLILFLCVPVHTHVFGKKITVEAGNSNMLFKKIFSVSPTCFLFDKAREIMCYESIICIPINRFIEQINSMTEKNNNTEESGRRYMYEGDENKMKIAKSMP